MNKLKQIYEILQKETSESGFHLEFNNKTIKTSDTHLRKTLMLYYEVPEDFLQGQEDQNIPLQLAEITKNLKSKAKSLPKKPELQNQTHKIAKQAKTVQKKEEILSDLVKITGSKPQRNPFVKKRNYTFLITGIILGLIALTFINKKTKKTKVAPIKITEQSVKKVQGKKVNDKGNAQKINKRITSPRPTKNRKQSNRIKKQAKNMPKVRPVPAPRKPSSSKNEKVEDNKKLDQIGIPPEDEEFNNARDRELMDENSDLTNDDESVLQDQDDYTEEDPNDEEELLEGSEGIENEYEDNRSLNPY